MPRTLAQNIINVLGRRSGFAPINLLDIQTLSGTNYYWSDYQGSFPARITAGNQQYKPWIKSCGPFKLSRSLITDGGTVILQNVSGAITRELMKALNSDEFEGALCIYRWWVQDVEAPAWEFHCYVTAAYGDELQGTLQLLQLFDLSQQNALDVYSEQCTWRYKEERCGATDPGTVCSKLFTGTNGCQSHGPIERHNGMPFAPASKVTSPPSPGSGPGSLPRGPGGPGGPIGPGGGGPRGPRFDRL